eukprot:scaffold53196_cov28-Tisochrysis_lutea.AAC.5
MMTECCAAALLEHLQQEGAKEDLRLAKFISLRIVDDAPQRLLAQPARALIARWRLASRGDLAGVRCLPIAADEQCVAQHEGDVRHAVGIGHTGNAHSLKDARAPQLMRNMRHVEDGWLAASVRFDAAHIVHIR